MAPDARLSKVDLANPSYLLVSNNDGQVTVEPLTIGASVFVGSSANCKIQLLDETVQQIHFMALLEKHGVLKVQDWNTGSTYVNGVPSTDEVLVHSGDVITVGNCRLTVVLDVNFHETIAIDLLNEPDLEGEQETSITQVAKIDVSD